MLKELSIFTMEKLCSNMKILAFDTSTNYCSVALLNGKKIRENCLLAAKEHGQVILSMIAKLLDQEKTELSDLDLIAFGRGPGSFTGLRIAASVAQGLSFVLGIPVIGISTLEAMAVEAHQLYGAKKVLSLIDARMNEIYWGQYFWNVKKKRMVLKGKEKVSPPEKINLPKTEKQWIGVGSGWYVNRELLIKNCHPKKNDPKIFPRAKFMAEIALKEFAPKKKKKFTSKDAVPVYLRDRVVGV
jgi:tRNA threonylcarbamoyladenosine biosynthesis protein TsaB